MHNIVQDIRYALRSLTRTPGFTAVAVLTLALGIGAATAGFSLFNWLLLRPVPGVQEGSRLAEVWFGTESQSGSFFVSFVSYDQHAAIVAATPALSGLAGKQRGSVGVALGQGIPRRVDVEYVMPGYFTVLGTQPQHGRAFVAADDQRPNGQRVVVISDRLWRESFGGTAEAVGQQLRINGLTFTVIGIAPRGFHGTERLGKVDLWLPGQTYFDVTHGAASQRASFGNVGSPGFYEFVGRVGPDTDFDLAHTQLVAAVRHTATLNPNWTERLERVTAKVYPGVGLFALGRELVHRPVRLVLGIVALVLVIACANVANLLLLRAAWRRGEMAVRVALGATAGRLTRLHVAESLVLAAVGALAGILLASWLTSLFAGTRLQQMELTDVQLDWRVAAFAAAIALLSALAVTLAPVWSARRTDIAATLKDAAAVQLARTPLRGGLAVLQLSASLTLVVGALLLTRSLAKLADVPLGFEPAGVTAFTASPGELGYDTTRSAAYLAQLTERVAALPGVEGASLASQIPFVCCPMNIRIGRPGTEPAALLSIQANTVDSSYFEVLGIPVVVGRVFVPGDASPMILSLALARRLFGDADPIGQMVEVPRYRGAARLLHVVGVVGDSRWSELEGDPPLLAYEPLRAQQRVGLLVRSSRAAEELAMMVSRAARALDANLPLSEPTPLRVAITRQYSARRLLFTLLAVLAGVTVVLAGLGLYGLVSYGVTLRTREFGLRMALGAEGRRIIATAMRTGIRLAATGIVLGLAGAVAVSRLLRSYLFGVDPIDPASLVGAAVVLTSAALLASWIPARRASRVDPMVALRTE